MPSKTHWVSLKTIADDYLKENNKILDLYAAAILLKNKGYIKRRVSKGNVWGMIPKIKESTITC